MSELGVHRAAQEMASAAELQELIAEQAADDTYFVRPDASDIASMDAVQGFEEDSPVTLHDVIGTDPWDEVDELLDAGLDPVKTTYATGTAADWLVWPHQRDRHPKYPGSPKVASLWDELSIVHRLWLIGGLYEDFRWWANLNGTTFPTGRGRRRKNEKLMLAVWLQTMHDRFGIPVKTLAALTGRRPYRTVADLIHFARQLDVKSSALASSDEIQPSSETDATRAASDDAAPRPFRRCKALKHEETKTR